MKRLLLILGVALWPVLASAQAPQRLCIPSVNATTGLLSCQDVGPSNPLPVSGAGAQYPTNATPITGIGTGTTGAVVGTLAAAAGVTTYICGFDVSAIGGTAAVGPVVVSGLIGGSFTYQLSSSATGNTLSRTFTPCIPASAANTAIAVTTTADGTATAVDVNASGYRQ